MSDVIEIDVDLGVPLPAKYSYSDLKARVDAACNTANFLLEMGAQYPQPTNAEKEEAAKLATKHASGEQVSNKELANYTPQAITYAASILDEYGHRVAESASQIRNLITTKLLHETENADPRVRLKALELLGKISDVGLFSDKTEVTVTHRTSEELKSRLKEKLEKLINPPATRQPRPLEIEDAVYTETTIENDPDLDFSNLEKGDG